LGHDQTLEGPALEKFIVLIVFLILTAIFGGALARFFQRPDIADLIGNSIMGIIGFIILFVAGCYAIASLKLRYALKKEPIQNKPVETAPASSSQETTPDKNPYQQH
jgi:heme/copper-type cytochrome/quinol oxidase subunit 2